MWRSWRCAPAASHRRIIASSLDALHLACKRTHARFHTVQCLRFLFPVVEAHFKSHDIAHYEVLAVLQCFDMNEHLSA